MRLQSGVTFVLLACETQVRQTCQSRAWVAPELLLPLRTTRGVMPSQPAGMRSMVATHHCRCEHPRRYLRNVEAIAPDSIVVHNVEIRVRPQSHLS